jgi:hypothetical protein
MTSWPLRLVTSWSNPPSDEGGYKTDEKTYGFGASAAGAGVAGGEVAGAAGGCCADGGVAGAAGGCCADGCAAGA